MKMRAMTMKLMNRRIIVKERERELQVRSSVIFDTRPIIYCQ